MEIKIQSQHFKLNDTLKEYVNNKAGKLAHLSNQITACEVNLKLDKSDKDMDKVCEIKLVLPEGNLFALNQCETFEEATNKTVEAIEAQLRKRKTKLSHH